MFRLDKSEFIEDINSTGYIYTHHSGGKLVFIENEDTNRVFSIAFRTMPEDDCGTAHIVEHCVLCGSENYNIKDPFNILDKGSLHTYLNAMTYQDKTLYPIGSTNEKDFMAMLRVYCDAVFNPIMYKNEGIFRQEGWNSDGKNLNGVVLNEMNGVYSDSSEILDDALTKEIYEGTPYAYDSGGKPDDIPKLDYNKFLEFHKKNYHPSNAIIYIYGKLNINKYLEILDNEFIGNYEYRENKFNITMPQKKYRDITLYGLTTGKNTLQAVYPTGKVEDFSKCIILDILCDLLFNIEGAYIKEQLRDLGEQISASFSDSSYFTNLNIEITGSSETNVSNFRERLNNAFKSIEIDDYKLQGVINSYRFYFKEEDFGYKPRGLFYNTLLLRAFMYENYTFEPIRINRLFDSIKNIDIKELIKKYFVDKGCFGILIDKDINAENTVIPPKNNDCVIKYRNQTDDPNDIKKINVSKVSDISKEPFLFDYTVDDSNIFVPIKSDVTYIDVLFDAKTIPKEYLPALGLWARLADIYDIKYSNDIDYYLGGMSAGIRTLSIKDNYKAYFTLKIKTLNENIDKAKEIVSNIISLKPDNNDRLTELIKEQKKSIADSYISSGQLKGYKKAFSVLSEEYNFIELTTGANLYNYITTVPVEKIQQDINYVLSIIFNRNNMLYSVCGSKFVNILPALENRELKLNTYGLGTKESIAVKSNVNFNCMGFLIDCRHGSYRALQQLLTREYMWDNIRLEGGAYGGGLRFTDGNKCYMYSYRDPQLARTYNVFNNISDYILTPKPKDEIDRFILGAINEADAPVKNSSLNTIATGRHIIGTTTERLYIRREELLSTTPQDIVRLGETIKEEINKNCICTVGKKQDIENNMDLLERYIEI